MSAETTFETAFPSASNANAAVRRCCDAHDRAYKTSLAKGESDYSSSSKARRAFFRAMPPLDGYENIRDFIACVAHGMHIDFVLDDHSSKLLYAAQVALGVYRNRPTPPKPAAKSPTPANGDSESHATN
jgi:hypothetical protein